MTPLPPVCILAGGRGTRLGPDYADLPKALVPVAGRPFLHHVLDLLAAHGAERIVLCTGYRGEQIAESVGDGSSFGLVADYAPDGPTPLGTAGAVGAALPLLGERFLLLYGDTYLRIDYGAVVQAALASGLPALMTVLRNEGRWDTSNTHYADGRVLRYDKAAPGPDLRYIDYGLSVLTPEAMALSDEADLAPLLSRLAADGMLAGYEASERFYEIGTPASLAEADDYLGQS